MIRKRTILLLCVLTAGCQYSPFDRRARAHGWQPPETRVASRADKPTRVQVIYPEDVPAEVQGNFARDFPGSFVRDVKKKAFADGSVQYSYRFDDYAYHEHFASYNPTGVLVKDHPAGPVEDYWHFSKDAPPSQYDHGPSPDRS